ncbi:MAG: FHA domain-containing protein [Deltaproteobacteria bacterium]|nr:MAG: FHA domain-containing protein [Deltaproteobacteria bacterium]
MADAFLQIVSGARQGLNVPLVPGGQVVIGRKRGDLILDDALVSGRHCRIRGVGGQFVLQDLGSTNGTMVDGRLVREVTLRPGAEVTIGSTRMILYVGEPPASKEEKEQAGHLSELDIAWLLDEELVELQGGGRSADLIGQDLRLPPGFHAEIEVVAGSDQGTRFGFSRGNNTIGRRTGEVPLTDVEVSRHHAVIEVFGRQMIFLRDLGSTNGTYHNGRRVSVAKLAAGDTVGCGKTVMKLVLP